MRKVPRLVGSENVWSRSIVGGPRYWATNVASVFPSVALKLFLVSAFFLFSMVTTLSAAPAYVTGDTTACTATSCTASFTGANAGDVIVLGLFVVNSTSVSSVTDSQGATFTPIGSAQTWSPSNFVERLYYAKNVAAGSHTITVTLSASAHMELHTYDYSGLDTASPLDVSATAHTGTSTSGTTNSVTTTNANDLLFAFFHSDGGVTNTAGSGFTGRTPTGDNAPLGEDKNVTSTGPYTATMSFSASADYVGFLVAFKAAASGGNGGSPAYVTGDTTACTATSCTASFTGANAGDVIVLGLFVVNSTSVSSVTDSQGATFTPIGSAQTWSPSNFVERLYYAKNVAAGSHTITVTLSASAHMELHTYDYSGLDTASPLDVSATAHTGTSTSGTTNSVTTTNANDLLFAFFHSDGGVTNTAGSGFTGRTPTGDNAPLGEDKNVTSTGPYTATMSFSASADYVGFLVAFKAAAGGGGGTPPSISTQPSNQTVTVGQQATFTVVATGTAPLTYQWQKNGTNISGATSSTYTTPATTSGDNGSTFLVTVNNSYGSVTSNSATLTVTSSSSNVYYYLGDMLGSSRTIVQDGQTTPCYDADLTPFGTERVVTNSCPQNYKFEGKERDGETGNDDFGARYYTSRLGRWLSADWSAVPAAVPYANLTNPQTLNLYAMVSENPETFADLDGHETQDTLDDQSTKDAGEVFAGAIKGLYNMAAGTWNTVAGLLNAQGQSIGLPYTEMPTAPAATYDNATQAVSGAAAQLGTVVYSAVEGAIAGGSAATGVPDANVVVRGGQGELPATGTYSGAHGTTLEEAASGVPHGTVRSSTAGAIRESGGSVVSKPEPAYPGGPMNQRHVNVKGGQKTFGPPKPNPVPKSQRVPSVPKPPTK